MRRILMGLIAIGMAASSGACIDGSALARHNAAEASDAGVWVMNRDLAAPDASEVRDEADVVSSAAPAPDLVASRSAQPSQAGRR